MKKFTFLFIVILLTGCGGSHYLKVTDALQVRPLLNDDPLAVKILSLEGEEIRVGDVVLTETMIEWHSVKKVAPDRFDLVLNMKASMPGAGGALQKETTGNRPC